MTIPSTATSAPDTGSGACFAVSHDAELPATLGHVDGASPVPGTGTFFAVTSLMCSDSRAALPGCVNRHDGFLEPNPALDWNARVLQGLDMSYAARLQQRAERHHILIPALRMPAPPITTSTTPPAPSCVTDWEAELRFRFSESHLARLERRQLSNPYSKISTRREGRHAAEQRLHDMQQQNAKLAKRMTWADEQHVHDLKRSDLDWDVVRTRLDEAKEHRKQRDVADAWRTHILEQRKGKTWEQHRHLDQVIQAPPKLKDMRWQNGRCENGRMGERENGGTGGRGNMRWETGE
ncbi:hypothetical protein DEU56DRAFT_761499 [Suillus clintonianus]|uniref:uncharacterized protein n=1 Tax=Suillus clintonianus TaxID=1904413 RepID=UPI001B87296F|nr:uncharacterized protein DEU56DRAFT_761499 [Suillus clintonianus]KAG2116773.1 hypothetical protein DEU56DRAFT_761499 [Suillus clintonianus]